MDHQHNQHAMSSICCCCSGLIAEVSSSNKTITREYHYHSLTHLRPLPLKKTAVLHDRGEFCVLLVLYEEEHKQTHEVVQIQLYRGLATERVGVRVRHT